MEKAYTFIKSDTSSNWNKADKFIPKENEVIVYTDIHQTKIGNGKDKLKDLPFINTDSQYLVDGDVLIINSPDITEVL